jgi:hypothetical protein
VPKAAERAQLAAEREKLAGMPPFRRITGPATKQAIRRTLRMALNKAIGKQLITFNAAQHVELDPAARPKGLLWTASAWHAGGRPGEAVPVMVWTRPSSALPRRRRGLRLYAFFHLIATTACAEARAWARAGDFSPDAQAPHPSLAEIVVDGWTPIETAPKTDGSMASVKLDAETVRVLLEHRARQRPSATHGTPGRRAPRRRARTRGLGDTGKMFTAEDGSLAAPGRREQGVPRISDAAGLPPINLRDLRHGAAALVKAGGGDMHDAKVKLRHSTITLTVDTYMELFEEYEDELTERRGRRARGTARHE